MLHRSVDAAPPCRLSCRRRVADRQSLKFGPLPDALFLPIAAEHSFFTAPLDLANGGVL